MKVREKGINVNVICIIELRKREGGIVAEVELVR